MLICNASIALFLNSKQDAMKTLTAFLLTLLFFPVFAVGQNNCDTLSFFSQGSKLNGYFYPSKKPGSPTLLFTQGIMETGDIWNFGQLLSNFGIHVFMFDFRGCFGSEGKQGLKNSQEDIGAAIAFLASAEMVEKYGIDTSQLVLGGYSYGGHMSMLYAVHHPEVKRVISVSGGDLGIFGDLVLADSSLRKGYSGFFQSIRKPDGPVDFQYDDPIQELLDNHDYFRIREQAAKLSQVDILMIGGLDDNVVSMEKYLMPLYRELKKNEGQLIQFLVYQTGHSYKKARARLLADMTVWITDPR